MAGLGYNGDKSTTVTANTDVLAIANEGITVARDYYELSFLNDQDCTIIINGGRAIPIGAEQGVQIDINDKSISSIVIVETGIGYKWFGKY